MIERLKSGNRLITLGQGTVFTGNVCADKDEKPFGIYFRNKKGKDEKDEDVDWVIVALPDNKAMASYLMAFIRFVEAYVDEDSPQELKDIVKSISKDLQPLLPKAEED